ncbi:tRNA (N(6)-L-threonylcarbamoyladenosine(37)-C(2))-methylthiotransferase [Candidatus Woesearchaeota archaeon]|jgi:threonylcarbamoyladenosine tRNA methylthiotransferase CDKAL1|nr:tRNA (N(6)-L-threonylcarbamoyladenosine(37)-C(2))-methylthiotransferase [Candidatus Woesearchaeota archaeon]MBT3538127.1 tRNA (N(6)-L-threonylcarbamoyladenosine(37)-C(2))-methylthiotransferase [Candidatus Woesearchaeota archaeon]MBT4697514.1 tRNA (N(6)-L-threonylcarbamoyladenosine(37)-C(2))-methylthiotransferase [Candidatus Woesearchaeota archaeon]MBT4717361.1 tRNA (N(6)-L-threonylcarbamoyladenosine(37)-C(2))-methylthiotransferase [Candidatus Woesearchaeota archaeon]MBT7105796.1 tRNA (N(6)-L
MTKIFIQTYGCALNNSDSELMAGLLKDAGFEIANNLEECTLTIINTCTVKQNSETKFFRALKKAEEENKKVVVAGCIPQADHELLNNELKNISVIGTKQLNKILEAVVETLSGHVFQDIKDEKNQRLNLPKIRKNPIIEIVPICEGCLGNCSYCKTKQARGDLFSYNTEKIITQIKDALKDGVKEIWITAQDTGTYGKDIDTNIVDLLNKIIEIEGDFKVRMGMCNPNYIKEHLKEIIKILKHKNMFKFIHIPIQSGSNNVLKHMRRKYTQEEYYEIIETIKKEIPDITIATDIIVGYPTETDKDFELSLKLIQETKPSVMNLSRYWPRPKTDAANLKPITSQIVMERSKKIKKLFTDINKEENKDYINQEVTIIIDETGKDNTMIGRNDNYKQVIVNTPINLGKKTTVKIVSTTEHYLRAF